MADLEVMLRVEIYILALILLTSLFWYIIQVLCIRSKRRGVKTGLFILSIILACGTLLGMFTFYVYHGIGHQPDIYRSGKRSSNMVALTFDDGPGPEFTPPFWTFLKSTASPPLFYGWRPCGEIP